MAMDPPPPPPPVPAFRRRTGPRFGHGTWAAAGSFSSSGALSGAIGGVHGLVAVHGGLNRVDNGTSAAHVTNKSSGNVLASTSASNPADSTAPAPALTPAVLNTKTNTKIDSNISTNKSNSHAEDQTEVNTQSKEVNDQTHSIGGVSNGTIEDTNATEKRPLNGNSDMQTPENNNNNNNGNIIMDGTRRTSVFGSRRASEATDDGTGKWSTTYSSYNRSLQDSQIANEDYSSMQSTQWEEQEEYDINDEKKNEKITLEEEHDEQDTKQEHNTKMQEEKVDNAEEAILAKTVRIRTEPPQNRLKEYPERPQKADPLIVFALRQLKKPIHTLIREQVTYDRVKIETPQVPAYECDETARVEKTTKGTTEGRGRNASVSVASSTEDSQNRRPIVADALFGPQSTATVPKTEELQIDPKYLEQNAQTLSKQLAEKGAERDGPLMWQYQPDFNYNPSTQSAEVTICKRYAVPLWKSSQQTQVYFSAQKLLLANGSIEPLFLTAALYDLRAGVRLSEDFPFDLNGSSLLSGPLSVNRNLANPLTMTKHAIFSIAQRHPDIQLVIRIERVLSSDLKELEIYTKLRSKQQSELATLCRKARDRITNLGEYRQPLAWSMHSLFDDAGDFRGATNLVLDHFFLQEATLSDDQFMQLAREVDKRSPKQCVGVSIHILLQELTDSFPRNRISADLIPVKDAPINFDASTVAELNHAPGHAVKSDKDLVSRSNPSLVQELQYFTEYSSLLPTPFTDFTNLIFVYPEMLKGTKDENLVCKVHFRESCAPEHMNGSPLFRGKSSGGASVACVWTQVNYHKKLVYFQDEFKLRLPLQLSNQAHLFFEFSKVSCTKRPGSTTLQGWAVLPLYRRGRLLIDARHELYIARPVNDSIPNDYFALYLKGAAQSRNSLNISKDFAVRTKLVSSVYTSDEHFNYFFQGFPGPTKLADLKPDEAVASMRKCIEHLRIAQHRVLIYFLPALFDKIFNIFTYEHESSQYAGFVSLIYAAEAISSASSEPHRSSGSLLSAYVTHKLSNPSNFPLFIPVSRMLLLALQQLDMPRWSRVNTQRTSNRTSDEHDSEKLLLQHLWFVFDCIVKSATLEMKRNDGHLDAIHQKALHEHLEQIITILCTMFGNHRNLPLTYLRIAVNNLALFLLDLFSVLDHERALSLLLRFTNECAIDCTNPVLVELKFDAYQIVLDSPYLLDIMQAGLFHPTENDFEMQICRRYPVIAQFVTDFVSNLSIQSPTIREKVVNSLRFTITKIDFDALCSSRRADVATMFMILLPRFLKSVDLSPAELSKTDSKSLRNTMVSVLWVLRNVPTDLLRLWWRNDDLSLLSDMLRMLEVAIGLFAYAGELRADDSNYDSIISSESAVEISSGQPLSSTIDYRLSIESIFTSGPLAMSQKSNSLIADSPNNGINGGASKTGTGSSSAQKLREMRASMTKRSTFGSLRNRGMSGTGLTVNANSSQLSRLRNLESIMCSEVSFCVIRTLNLLLEDFAKESTNFDALTPLIDVYLTFLRSNQSNSIVLLLFAQLQVFVRAYGLKLHADAHLKRKLGELASEVFRYCTFLSKDVRCSAVSLLLIMLSVSFDVSGSIDYLQMHLTMSLSKLTSSLKPLRTSFLQEAFHSLRRLADSTTFHCHDTSTFVKELDRLIARLGTILNDSLEIARQTKLGKDADPTSTEFLLLAIANAFNHISEIRIEWLSKLATHHSRQGNFAEAACTHVMIADIIGSQQCFVLTEPKPQEIDKQQLFHWERAAKFFDSAELYEHCADIYNRLLPLAQRYNDYSALSRVHMHLHNVYDKLIDANSKNSRMLGTYYRVLFVGQLFGRLHNQEVIYKMPKITRLVEITDELRNLYSKQLGVSVRLDLGSGPIDTESLASDECVMQVTYLQPFFDPSEKLRRQSFIEQHTDLAAFKYSSPFTATGRSYAENLADQQKRVTKLFVSHSFPYICTVQSVLRREETILSPIESATDDVDTRTHALLSALQSQHVNAKQLSGILAGSIATQVHGGVREIASVFLMNKDLQPIDKSIKEDASTVVPAAAIPTASLTVTNLTNLKLSLSHFLNASSEALDKHRELLRAHQQSSAAALLSGSSSDPSSHLKPSFPAITERDLHFQANLEHQLADLQSFLLPLLSISSQSSLPMTTAGDSTGSKRTRKAGGVRFADDD